MALRLVVGLGNPGTAYERTRHNVGFRLVDRLVDQADPSWREFKGLGLAAKRGELWVVKPMTYMNESGRFVKTFAGFHNISVAEILVVYDEISLPLGKIRLRKSGSAGGQKGMLSVIQQLGTEAVPRLRIGVGPQPQGLDSADFVLGRFKPDEEKALAGVLDLAAEAVELLERESLDNVMNRYNPA